MKDQYESRQEKESGVEIVISNPFLKWWDNFWYHHKWTVIVSAFFLVVFVVCFVQCSQRTLSDLYVTFSGGVVVSEEEGNAISQVMGSLLPVKEGENASKVGVVSYTFFSEEELRTLYTDPETGNVDYAGINRANQANADRFKSLQDYMMTGECSIWLLSPTVYEELHMKNDIGVSLETTFGSRPACAHDDYAIRLGDTELYRYYEALQVLPEDTLVVLSASFVWGASSDDVRYAQIKELFRAIVEFKVPD